MWVYSSLGVATLISTDLTSKALGLTINTLSSTLSYLSHPNNDITIQNYKNELERQDIEFKLKLIDHWLKMITEDQLKENNNLNLIYKAILDSCHQIDHWINQINEKIKYHQTKWFYTWRTLDLENDIKAIKKNTKILNERLRLINLVTK